MSLCARTLILDNEISITSEKNSSLHSLYFHDCDPGSVSSEEILNVPEIRYPE